MEDRLNHLRQTTLEKLFARWPGLRWSEAAGFRKAADEAARELDGQPDLCRELLDAQTAYDRASAALENEEAFLLRFTRLCASVVRADRLRESDDERLKARFARLWQAEQRSLPLASGTAW